MLVEHLSNPEVSSRLLVLADIHINSSLSEEFERSRVDALASVLEVPHYMNSTIVFAGDIFDRNTPSLTDIKIFYSLIARLNTQVSKRIIYVINGNHDNSTFDYLPSSGFTHIDTPTVINNTFLLVPWTHTKALDIYPDLKTFKDLILISHARCTIPPYITEEISIKNLSDNFKEVILGDIHTAPDLPYKNVTYTTSPSAITFSLPKNNAHGFLVVDCDKDKVSFKALDLPSKHLIVENNFDKAKHILEKRKKAKVRHFIKLRFTGSASEIRDLTRITSKFVVKDFSLLGDDLDSNEEVENKLKEFLKSDISIVDFAFGYFKDVLQINEQNIIDLKKLYEELRSKKGVHRK